MKPALKKFKAAAEKYSGNISAIASAFGVYRSTVYKWMEGDEQFRETVEEYRGRLLDKCIQTAVHFANGIPTFVEGDKGPVFAGWKVAPDGNTLRYLISTLGRKEGFGEAIDVTSDGHSIKPDPITIEVIDKREQIDDE